MSQSVSMDARRVISTINEIIEDISTLATSATHFRSEVEAEAKSSDAAFMKNLTKGVSGLEAATKQCKNAFLEIQEAVDAYVREFERFNQDSDL